MEAQAWVKLDPFTMKVAVLRWITEIKERTAPRLGIWWQQQDFFLVLNPSITPIKFFTIVLILVVGVKYS